MIRGRYAYYGIGAIAIGAYFLVHGRVQEIGYEVIGLYGVTAVLVGSRHNFANGGRRAWELFAAGLLLEVAGDGVYTVYDYLGRTVPTPSIADALYLAGYPLLAAGVLVLLRELGARASRAVSLDAIIAFVAVSTLQWVFVVASLLHAHVSTGAKLVDMAYPCADVLLVGAILQLLVVPTPRSATYRLLTLAVGLWFVGDEIYLLRPSDYAAGSWLDAVWLAAYVLWGGAAIQPQGAGLPAQDAAEPRLTRTRAVVLGVALLAVPATLAYEAARHGRPAHVLAAAIGIGVIAVLVLVRLADLLRAEIGARHEAEAMQGLLSEQNTSLRRLDQMKDEFVATVTHELRTPLTSISGYTDLLRETEDSGLSDEQSTYLKVVARNTDRLLMLVNDLLFAAGLQSSELAVDPEVVDLGELAREAVESVRPRAEAKGVGLRVETDGDTHVRGDRHRIAQLIDNLLSNAVKFTPEGGEVSVRSGGGDAGVLLEVRDSGIGIPAAEQEQLFTRFFRSSNAVADAIPGTGLGLYITNAIAQAHGGSIAVESAEGRGTTFVVTLPSAARAGATIPGHT
ncbi:MAG TPA: HAMP domain-containing sensor histidine kinase [Gaiellaceae bacterium]|nr:HAMP domain-containing sensor histidine kinase [Gaiellaceae bacterium]